MPFRLPSLKTAGQGEIPTHPRKLKRWLSELPLVNMGEATRQFYEGLRALNGVDLSPADRVELLELMRPMAGTILGHLGRHFVNRSLPLPEKSRRIAHLNRIILSELAGGYGGAVRDMLQAGRPRERLLSLAICRAMDYTGDILLNSWRLYENPPEGAWRELNRLYLAAEAHGALDRPVPDETRPDQQHDSVSASFKCICLTSLTHPLSLRQGETDRVVEYLRTVAHSTVISQDPMADSGGSVHAIDLSDDAPPVYIKLGDMPRTAQMRMLNLTPLAREIRDALQAGTPLQARDIGADLLHRILDGWTRKTRRRFSRAERDDKINVTIGLANIYATIEQDLISRLGPKDNLSGYENLTLQSIGGEVPDHNGHEAAFLSARDALGDAEAWDMVGRGNVITETYIGRPRAAPVTALGLGRRELEQEPWQMVNASAGGFCLRWTGEQTCRAQVGELIGLREKEGSQYQWRVGIIRWMLNKADRGLEIGVQVLAPKTLLIQMEPSRMGRPSGDAQPALLLPAIRTIQQPPTLLASNGKFRVGDEVTVSLAGRAMRIKLSGLGEHTSLFVQYRYTSLGQANPETRPAAGDASRLDDVWTLI